MRRREFFATATGIGAGALLYHQPWWWQLTLVLAALSFLPGYRRPLLCLATLYWAFTHTLFDWAALEQLARLRGVEHRFHWGYFQAALIVASLAASVGYYTLINRLRQRAPFDRPVRLLLVLYLGLLLLIVGLAFFAVA